MPIELVGNIDAMDVTDVKSKALRMKEHQDAEIELAKRMDRLIQESDDAPRGCGGCLPRWRREKVSTTSEARVQSSTEARLFGQRGKQADAAQKLNHAAESVAAHVDQLSQKAEAARQKAMELKAAGKRAEALAALKKAKGLEKQLETASATHVALEQQLDVLSQSALQKEIATALSASVATTKRKTKGLLSKTEDAVDGATELRDFAEDVASTLTGIQQDTFDEQELLDELDAMADPPSASVAGLAAATTSPVSVASATSAKAEPVVAEPQAIVVGVDPTQYPAAPKGRVERTALLAEE